MNSILLLFIDLKKAPYLRADAARRNRRKTQEFMKQISRDVHAGTNNGINNHNHNHNNNNNIIIPTEVHF